MPEGCGVGHGRGKHFGNLLGSIGGRATAAWAVVQPFHAVGIEALEPVTHRLRMQAKVAGTGRDTQALRGMPNHLGSFNEAGFGSAGMGETFNHLLFFSCQFA